GGASSAVGAGGTGVDVITGADAGAGTTSTGIDVITGADARALDQGAEVAGATGEDLATTTAAQDTLANLGDAVKQSSAATGYSAQTRLAMQQYYDAKFDRENGTGPPPPPSQDLIDEAIQLLAEDAGETKISAAAMRARAEAADSQIAVQVID